MTSKAWDVNRCQRSRWTHLTWQCHVECPQLDQQPPLVPQCSTVTQTHITWHDHVQWVQLQHVCVTTTQHCSFEHVIRDRSCTTVLTRICIMGAMLGHARSNVAPWTTHVQTQWFGQHQWHVCTHTHTCHVWHTTTAHVCDVCVNEGCVDVYFWNVLSWNVCQTCTLSAT